MKIPFNDVDFWLKVWQEEQRDSLSSRRKAQKTTGEYWDRRAAGFAKLGRRRETKEQLEKVMRMLEYYGGMNKDSRVLDIGCGPGNYTIPIAKKVSKVTALDPSPEMLRHLEQRLVGDETGNIETHLAYWEDVDLAALGWEHAFDVVVAMRTPGINNEETLRKMIAASCGSCLLAGHLRREDEGRKELWRRLFNEEMPAIGQTVFAVMHLLYAWGYSPNLEIEHRVVTQQVPEQEMIDHYKNHLHPYLDLTAAVEAEIRRVVSEGSTDGLFTERQTFTTGFLTWQV